MRGVSSRQDDLEAGSARRRAGNPHCAIVAGHDAVHDGQADADAAAACSSPALVKAGEALEDPLAILGPNAGAVIVDVEHDPAVSGPGCHVHTGLGMSNRVVEEVADDPSQVVGVPRDDGRVDLEVHRRRLTWHREVHGLLVQHLGEVHVLRATPALLLHARLLKKIVDERFEPEVLLEKPSSKLGCIAVGVGERHLEGGTHCGKGAAQLVGRV